MTHPSTYTHHPTTPPNIIKELPKMINKRLSEISSTPEDFNSAKGDYEAALKRSGHNTPLTYQPNNHTNTKNKKKQNQTDHMVQPTLQQHSHHQHWQTFLQCTQQTLSQNQQIQQNLQQKHSQTILQLYQQHPLNHLSTQQKTPQTPKHHHHP